MRRALRIGAWTAGGILLVLLLLAAAVMIAGNTARGRLLIEAAVARLSSGQVVIAGLGGSFPESLQLASLQLSDKEGIWLRARRIALHWRPRALLHERVWVEHLGVGQIELERLPHDLGSGGGSSSWRFDADQVTADRISISPAVSGVGATLSLQGSAHWDPLGERRAQLRAHSSDDSDRYQVDLDLTPAQLEARAALQEKIPGPLAALLHVTDLGPLTVDGTLHGPIAAAAVQLRAQAGEFAARAQGRVDLPGQAADLDYSVRAPRMTPIAGVSWQQLALSGHWHGPFNTVDADGDVRITDLRLADAVKVGEVQAQLRAQHGQLDAQVQGQGVVLRGAAAQLLAASPLRLTAAVNLADPRRLLQLNASHTLFALTAQAPLRGPTAGRFDLTLQDLAPLARLAATELRGRARISGNVTSAQAGLGLTSTARAELSGGPPLWTGLLGRTPQLEFAGEWTGSGASVRHLQLSGSQLTLSATGQVTRAAATSGGAWQQVHARWEANLPNLTALSPQLAGRARVTGEASGPVKSFAARLQALSTLSVNGSAPGTLQADVSAGGLPAAGSAKVQLRGALDGAPVEVQARVSQTPGAVARIVIEHSSWKSAQAQADLTLAPALAQSHGSLQLRMDQLGDLAHLTGMELAGRMTGALTLAPGRGSPQTHLVVDGQDLRIGGVGGDLHLTASGAVQTPAFQLAAHIAPLAGSAAQITAAGTARLQSREVALTAFTLRSHEQSLHLRAPATVALADGVAVKGVQLGLQQATLQVDGRITPQLQLQAVLQHVDAALLQAFVPGVLAQGQLEGSAQLSGTLAAPEGTVHLAASQLLLADSAARDLPPLTAVVDATLHGSSADLDGQVGAGRRSRLQLHGRAPLNAHGVYDLQLAGALNLQLANALLESRGSHTAGELRLDLKATGPATAPQLAGSADLLQAELRDYRLGVHLADITAHLTATHTTLTVESLTARSGRGRVTLGGTVGLLQTGMPVDLHFVATDATPIASDILTVNADADLKLQGALSSQASLAGTVNVRRAEINIPNSFPPNVAVLDVRRPGQAPPAPAGKSMVVGLKLEVNAPRQILVKGRGLDAELGGRLRVAGTSEEPEVRGGFDLIRGRFALASTSLNFTRGRVSFNSGGPNGKIDPSLDFTAAATGGDSAATLRVYGFADAPQFELNSTPPLPQDEILSRLLFGQNASALSAAQAAQLGAALASLSGLQLGGPNLLARLQKRLQLDRLQVGSVNNPGGSAQGSSVMVQAGRYIGDRVFVGARDSSVTGMQLDVDVDLTQRLKLRTRLGNNNSATQGTTPENDPGSSVGLRYEFEY